MTLSSRHRSGGGCNAYGVFQVILLVLFVPIVESQNVTLNPSNQMIMDENTSICNICPVEYATLRETTIASREMIVTGAVKEDSTEEIRTCSQWQSEYAANILNNSSECLELQFQFMMVCCSGLPPVYESTQDILQHLFYVVPFDPTTQEDQGKQHPSAPYNSHVIPQVEWGTKVNVRITAHLTDLSIVNPGVNGGTVEVGGIIHLSWLDKRLEWDPTVFGITEINVKASRLLQESDIWVPSDLDTIMIIDQAETSPDMISERPSARVRADGTVFWQIPLHKEFSCIDISLAPQKVCRSSTLLSGSSPDELLYVPGDLEIDEEINQGLYGQVVNPHFSNITVTENEILVYVHIDPLLWSCQVCGGGDDGSLLQTTVIPSAQTIAGGGLWAFFSPADEGWTCQEWNMFLSEMSVFDAHCTPGRAALEDDCCQKTEIAETLSSQCEDALRQQEPLTSMVASSPPSSRNNKDEDHSLDLQVRVKFEEVLGRDDESNTMKLVVVVELIWFDDRLSWHPFVGGCHSYPADLTRTTTPVLWLPEFRIVNLAPGTPGLSQSQVTVYEDGMVSWKREGFVEVACEVPEDLEFFPLDLPSCFVDFGSSTPHNENNVRYIYSNDDNDNNMRDVIDNGSDNNKTPEVLPSYDVSLWTTLSSSSGNSDEVLRFKFYFERATKWYMLTFVYLYMLSTYSSFGMFLLDHRVGERLGYGTSILFVMVAQDITMSQYIPTSEELLWIELLALGSKVFVIAAIIESLFILFFFFNAAKLSDDEIIGIQNQEDSLNHSETEPLLLTASEESDDVPFNHGGNDEESNVEKGNPPSPKTPEGGQSPNKQKENGSCSPAKTVHQTSPSKETKTEESNEVPSCNHGNDEESNVERGNPPSPKTPGGKSPNKQKENMSGSPAKTVHQTSPSKRKKPEAGLQNHFFNFYRPMDTKTLRRYQFLRNVDRVMMCLFVLLYSGCIVVLFLWAAETGVEI